MNGYARDGYCLFFDAHLPREEWLGTGEFWPMWDMVEAMHLNFTDRVCSCMRNKS
jgi:hypothetical protein